MNTGAPYRLTAPIYTQRHMTRGKNMVRMTKKSRLQQLESLLKVLATAIDEKPGARDLAQLAKQYRETLAEIEAIKGTGDEDDEIGEILSKRSSDGKTGAIR